MMRGNRHRMEGLPDYHCSCGERFAEHGALAEHVRLTIDCPHCGTRPALSVDGALFRWSCGCWIAADDPSARLRFAEAP
jgi:DNA-directed RNA polymerase subunit RPC12/RpoP